MTHPYAQHREHKASHNRVKHVLKSGGVARPHHEEAADRTLFGKMLKEHDRKEHKVAGHKGAKRYARGGKVKHVTTNVIVAPNKPSPPSAAGPQAGPPIPTQPPMGGPALPPGMPPPGMGGPPMMRARGGRAIAGEASPGNLDKWSGRATKNSISSKVSYKRGGRLPTAGASTGVGRLQEAEMVRRRGH